MADAMWAAFSSSNAALSTVGAICKMVTGFASDRALFKEAHDLAINRPHFGGSCVENDGHRHGRNSFYGSTGTQSAAGDCATLVVPKPLPRHGRTAPLPGMHPIVTSA
jgi:hypothetical protein